MRSGPKLVAALAVVFLAIAGGIATLLFQLRTRGSDPAIYAMWVPPGFVPEALPDPRGPGAQLVVRYCTHCHALPWPTMHTAAEWPEVMRRMLARIDARMMKPPPAPSPQEEAAILVYLQTYARPAEGPGTSVPTAPSTSR